MDYRPSKKPFNKLIVKRRFYYAPLSSVVEETVWRTWDQRSYTERGPQPFYGHTPVRHSGTHNLKHKYKHHLYTVTEGNSWLLCFWFWNTFAIWNTQCARFRYKLNSQMYFIVQINFRNHHSAGRFGSKQSTDVKAGNGEVEGKN